MADNMQNEAMERLKQMYSKANPVAQNTAPQHKRRDNKANSQMANPQANKQTSPQTAVVTQAPQSKEQEAFDKCSSEKGNLLDIFMRDKEKSLIVLLIVILISEKADTTLILALIYLIL